MAEPKPFVFDNYQRGIADSPHVGLQDVRNLEVLGSPGSASLSFRLDALTKPPTVSALAYTTNTGTDVVTVASTSGWYNGMAIELNTVVTSTGISTGRVYWVGDLTATTFRLYKNPSLNALQVVDVTGSNGSGTLSSYTLSAPLDRAVDHDPNVANVPASLFILDDAGRVWWVKNYENAVGSLTSNLVYLGNDTLTASDGNRAVVVWKNHLMVFRTDKVDYLPLAAFVNSVDFDSASGWVYGWDNRSNLVGVARRAVLVGQDDVLYFQNGQNRIGSYAETEDDTFDPTDGASFTESVEALDLPEGEDVISIGELGASLLIGTKLGNVYPWDRSSASANLPIQLPELNVHRILTVNNIAYLFAGNTGNVYWTNSSSVGLFRKFPDHLSGARQPYYSWGDVMALRNQIYFSLSAAENDGTTLSATAGVWAIDTTTGALRHTHTPSHGNQSGSVTVLLPHVLSSAPPGDGLYVGWTDSGTHGVDVSSTNRHASGHVTSALETVGTAWSPRRFSKLYLELGRDLASGQGVALSYRTSLSDGFTAIGTYDHATFSGIRSFEQTFNLSAAKVQVRAQLTTGTSDLSPELLSVTLL